MGAAPKQRSARLSRAKCLVLSAARASFIGRWPPEEGNRYLASSNKGNSTRYVAIDLGASTGRLIAGEISRGKLHLTEAGRFKTPMARDAATGYQCWDLDEIVAQIEAALGRCTASGAVASVG